MVAKPTYEELEQKVKGLEKEALRRKKVEEALKKINTCLLSIGSDFTKNVNRITALCGDLFGATFALYNRLDGGILYPLGQWQTPTDYNPVDKPDGHICYDVIKRGTDDLFVVRDLQNSIYAKTDPNIVFYGLKTYIGHPVKIVDQYVGSLCVVFQRDYKPSEEDKRTMGILASAIRVDEERKLAENAQLDIEATLSQAQQLSHVGSWEWNLIDNSFQMSDEMLRIYGIKGRSKFDNIKSLIDEIIHPDNQDMIIKASKAAIADLAGGKLTYKIIRPDGEIRWIAATQTQVRRTGRDGEPEVMMGAVKDITERKLAEEALWQKTHDLGERVKELNCLYGIANLVEQQDISLEEILQATVDLIPLSWQYPKITCARIIIQNREWKTKNFRETIWKQASDIKVHGELSGNLEVYYLEENPEIDEDPFLREERNLINAIAMLTGRIVERKQGEEALRVSEEKYRSIFENIQDVYYEVTLDGIILEISPSIEEVSIYKREEVIGKSLYDIYVDPKKREEFVKELLKNRKVTGYEILLQDKDGSQGYCSITAKLVYDKHGKPVKIIGSMHNISERKQAEDRIRNLSQMLMQSQERERQMISYELHDRIAQNLSWLKMSLGTFFKGHSDISSELIEKMKEFSNLTEQSIIAVRDLSYDLRPPGLDVMGLVAEIKIYCEEFSEKTGLEINFQSAGMHKLNLTADTKIHLYRLIQEGLNNIHKHADAGQVTIKLVGASPNIILRIEDDGKGFDVKARELALDNEKRMGLRSMQERVNLLQGQMTIQSRQMKGTKIFIKLAYWEQDNESKEKRINH